MKNIGLKLKEKREENGVSVEEAAEDLKVRPTQINNLEEGKREEFNDVLFLKYFIRDYSKYLGLDSEKMVDEFDEYLFDSTSKIPIEEIEQAKKEKKDEKNKVSSPYTAVAEKNNSSLKTVLIIIALIVVIVGIYLLVSKINRNDFEDDDVTYLIGGTYE